MITPLVKIPCANDKREPLESTQLDEIITEESIALLNSLRYDK